MNAANSDKDTTTSAGESPEQPIIETTTALQWEAQRETDLPIRSAFSAHLILLAALYAIITFVAMISVRDGTGNTGALITFTIVFGSVTATVLIIAVWAAFGERSYFVRYALSHLVGGMMVIAVVMGMLGVNRGAPGRELFVILVFLVAAIPPVSLAAQAPFLFLRFIIGWQFVYKQRQVSRAFDLRDMFAFIFVFSLGIGAPQIALTISRTVYYRNEHTIYFVAEDVLMAFAAISGLFFLLAICCIPTVLFVFGTKTLSAGFAFLILFTVGICCLLMLPLAAFNAPERAVASAACLVATASLAIWIPLAVIKMAGFRLTSPKREPAKSQLNSQITKKLPNPGKTSDTVHPLDAYDEPE